VHDHWICEIQDSPFLGVFAKNQVIKVGFIVSDRMQITVEDYRLKYKTAFQKYEGKIHDMFVAVYQKLMKIGYQDFDIHSANLMLNIDNTTHAPLELRIIDFGETRPLVLERSENEIRKTIQKL
jgi:hypothetical protein